MRSTARAGWCASNCSSTSARLHDIDPVRLAIDGRDVVDTMGTLRISVSAATAGVVFEETFEHHHRPTEDLDENGQGNCHTAFAFVAHRAVVDVDPELGLVKVVQIATAQDVGIALNPMSVIGQIEGGIAQGLGLAVMEEIILTDGLVRNASFTDYLLPTMLDMPPVVASDDRATRPDGTDGCQGGRRAAVHLVDTGDRRGHSRCDRRDLHRVPVRPSDICMATD